MDYKYLYVMFPKREVRISFITQSILTFGLRLETISFLLNADKDYLYSNLYKNNAFYQSLTKTFNRSLKDQEKAKEKFISYFNSLKEAHQNKDKEKIRELLRIINDKDAIKLAKEKGQYASLKDEEILIILKYQLKYMLSSVDVSKMFDLSRRIYSERVKKMENLYPELVAEYNELAYINRLPYAKKR